MPGRLLLLLLLLMVVPPLLAANKVDAGSASSIGVAALEQIKKARARVERDDSLTDEQKKPLLDLYDEAEEWYAKARDYQARTNQYLKFRSEAPRQISAIRKKLTGGIEAKPLDTRALMKKPLPELEQLVETEKADLSSREARVSELEHALAQDNQRPEAARNRLAEAKQALEALKGEAGFGQPKKDPLEQARQWRDQARARALEQEVRMLEQELLALPARKALDEAAYEEARKRLELSESRLQALESILNERRRKEVEKLSRTEEATQQAVAGKNPVLERIAAENAALGEQLGQATRELEKATVRDNKLREQAKWLQDMYRTTREKVEVAGISGALGQVLVEQRRHLPDLRKLRKDLAQIRRQITETSLRQIRHRETLRKLGETGEEALGEEGAGLSPEERRKLSRQLGKLLERKRELLKKLVVTDQQHLKALGELEVAMQGLLQSVQEYDQYLAEHLLWVRNTPMLTPADLKKLPGELQTIFDPSAWAEVGKELLERISRSPLAQLFMALLLLVTYLSRRLIRQIRRLHPGIARPGHGNFLITLRTLVLSLLQPLWLMLWMAWLYWLLRGDEGISLHGDSLLTAMAWSLPVFYSLLVARVLSMDGGLLQAHFRWSATTVRRLRRAMDYLLWLFVPASVITSIAIHVLPDGLGSVTVKLAFVVLAGTLSLFIYRILHPSRGLIAAYLKRNPQGYLSHLRWLWFLVLVALPLLLMLLALMGYVYNAATMLRYLVNTFWLLAALLLIHELAEFWLLLTRRRIAYKAALERRRAMHAEELSEGREGAEAELEREKKAREEAAKVDLATLSKESRKLLNAFLFIAGAAGLWLIWSPLVPALAVLDDIGLWQQTVTVNGQLETVDVTVGDVLSVLVILFVTVLAARNLPSLIEILLLQYFRISPGSRYTIRTLTGYLIGAAGAVALFKAVGGSWSQIQWLVAALSVGIGFGLQEIVANFISGLIILFERPIRVGDFVTVGDTDGTVTRIRIRATTILTRDRKELLVPNKEFITGRLLNWTLSDQTTRLKVVVGIRYGADVVLAEKIMLEAAREHPRVLKEPAPWVNFQDFGDSALILELRCIIDAAEFRVQVQSELRHAIDRGFRAAGMEIPFPQRDVHLDTLGPLEVHLQPHS